MCMYVRHVMVVNVVCACVICAQNYTYEQITCILLYTNLYLRVYVCVCVRVYIGRQANFTEDNHYYSLFPPSAKTPKSGYAYLGPRRHSVPKWPLPD